METIHKLPTSQKIRVGNASHTSTPQESNSSGGARGRNTSQQSQKQAFIQDSTPVGNPSLQSLTGAKRTQEDALTIMKLVAASTLNWLLVRILYLELGSVGTSDKIDYYEVRLPKSLWEHDGKVFRLK